MLDAALFLFLLGFLALGFRKPYVWVLAYLYVDVLAPGKMGWTLMPMLKPSLITFCAAFGGWLLTDPKKHLAFTGRQMLLTALLLYCFYTTSIADFPEEAGEKWAWVWKGLVFAIFLPFTLTTRLRIEGALLIVVLSIAAIVISAGIKIVLGGGGYENKLFFVNDNSGLYESSTLATVAIASIPLVLWLAKHGTIFPPDWRVTLFTAALIFACMLIPIGTEARTGLVCIAVLGVLALRDSKRRLGFIVAAGALGVVALPFIPQSYYDRMATLGSTDGDESASTRVAVWQWTIDYASRNPLGGGFDAYRGNKFAYDMPVRVESGNITSVEYREVVDEGRAYHSAIFEMLGEQGYPGIVLWLALHAAGLWQMERQRRRWRQLAAAADGDGSAGWQAPLATALQHAQLIYLAGSLFQGIAYQPTILMLIAIQIAVNTYLSRLAKAQPKIANTHTGRAHARRQHLAQGT